MAGSTEVADTFQLAGATLEGRFAVDRPVAEGGFGVVYHAQQAMLDRPVALKVLRTPTRYDAAARQQFLAAFLGEAKTVARITHPSIVLVYDFGVSLMPSGERAAWMALEWLTGVTLDDELSVRRGRGGRTPTECMNLLRPALAALAVVHAAGVAHRDLKPANIMLVPGPGGPTPKLLDFGIAKIMDPEEAPGTGLTKTRSAQVAYSPAYASPEQISLGRSGPWTDVHAMGLILTELLTDRQPLDGEDPVALYQKIVDPVRPTPGKVGVPVGPWEAVLSRALALSTSVRYRDAGELLHALEETRAEADAANAGVDRGTVGDGAGPSSRVDALAVTTAQSMRSEGVRQTTQRTHGTTEMPIITSPPASLPQGRQGSRVPLYLGGAVSLAVAAVAAVAIGGRAGASHPATSGDPAPSGSVAVAGPATSAPAAPAAPQPSASATIASPPAPVPSASVQPEVAPRPPAPAPRRSAPPAPQRSSAPAASSASHSGKLIVE